MYKYNNKLIRLFVGIAVFVVGVINHAIGFDLSEQIYSKFNDIVNKGYGDVYVVNTYSSNLSKNPYEEALSSVESRSMQLKIAGAQQIEDQLKQKGCNLSKKEIRGILYYFVPDFRTELSKSLKQSIGNYDSKKYVLTGGEIAQYCGKFYSCNKYQELDENSNNSCIYDQEAEDKCISDCKESACKKSSSELEKSLCEYGCSNKCSENFEKKYKSCVNERKWSEIRSTEAVDVMTSCRDFFSDNYELGRENKEIIQNVEDSQVGAEKYWNNSTEDSPYDIISDLAMLAKLLYRDAQEPVITPVLYKTAVSYKMPNFGNNNSQSSNGGKTSASSDNNQSAQGGGGGAESSGESNGESNNESNNGGSSNNNVGTRSIGDEEGTVSLDEGEIGKNKDPNDNPDKLVKKQDLKLDEQDLVVKALPIDDNGYGGYEELVEGLNLIGLESKDSRIFPNLCIEDEEIIEPDEEKSSEKTSEKIQTRTADTKSVEDGVKFSDLSDEEYQEIVDSMLELVDQYTVVSPEIEEKIKEGAKTRSDSIVNSTSPEDLENTANKIKNCYSSCEGLRIDQKASCMLKCSCSEIESPIFDPNKMPGMGPIFVIKFCGVPATSTSFSVGGKRIYSIEEGLYEMYGALDKLSREGKLGTWTQQSEFLDSSTKKMNIAKTFAFTISVEFVDIMNNIGSNGGSTKSETGKGSQYEEKQMKTNNDYLLSNYQIMNDLADSSTKNAYSVIGGGGKVSTVLQEKSLSANDRQESEDIGADADADRYGGFEEFMYNYLERQGVLWSKMSETIAEFDDIAKSLYDKKCS